MAFDDERDNDPMGPSPRVLLLDGDYPTTLAIAKELTVDLGATSPSQQAGAYPDTRWRSA